MARARDGKEDQRRQIRGKESGPRSLSCEGTGEDEKQLVLLRRNGSGPEDEARQTDTDTDVLSSSTSTATTLDIPDTKTNFATPKFGHLRPSPFRLTANINATKDDPFDRKRILPSFLSIPRPPKSTLPDPVQLFLRFHRERVTSAHYFAWYDYHRLFTNRLHSMADDSRALQFAMVAFSALVYAAKFHQPSAEQIAFHYYTLAIKQLQVQLNDLHHETAETALAAALQLSSFDVRTTSGIGVIDSSVSWGIQVNVSATWPEQHVSSAQCSLPRVSRRRPSDRPSWDGTASPRIITVFRLRTTLFCPAPGARKSSSTIHDTHMYLLPNEFYYHKTRRTNSEVRC